MRRVVTHADPIPTGEAYAAIVGDSLTSELYQVSTHYGINAVAGGVLNVLANGGIIGNLISDVLARIDNQWNDSLGHYGLGGLPYLKYVILRIGTNDCRAGSTWASVSGTYQSLINKIFTYTHKIILLDVPPIGAGDGGNFATENALTLTYNTGIDAIAAANPLSVLRVRGSSAVRNQDGTQAAGFFISDSVHPYSPGVAAMWMQESSDATLMASLSHYPSPVLTSLTGITDNWAPNTLMTGTGGGAGPGITGTVVNNWGINRLAFNSSDAATVCVVAADGGDTNQTPWQRITPTGSSGSGGGIKWGFALSALRTITATDPGALDLIAQYRFNALDRALVTKLQHVVLGDTNAADNQALVLTEPFYIEGTGTLSGTYVVRYKWLPTRNTTQASASFIGQMNFLSAFGPAASLGSLDVRCVSIRG